MSDLLVFGDSFPAGAELEDLNDRFPVLVANQLQRNLQDFSRGATSIDHVVWELMQYLKNNTPGKDCVALFCLTDPSRTLYFEGKNLIELTPHSDDVAAEAYFKYIYSDNLEKFNWEKNVAYLEYACYVHSIKAFFINNWKHPYKLSDIVKRSYNQSICELLGSNQREWDGQIGINPFDQERKNVPNKYFSMRYHPNAEGHRLIAHCIAEWIKTDG